ncbi:hypothetical protein chiPu_0018169 [Chiloscyllium punctatum]|uniref:GPS domain-containing protein n=1 Tax=Chiloscyllium punctatum TaxID=137246 RepID=A0A401RLE7_CHIPU|nr:hypothetical protein [Chiloscyllium punctatum]
MVLGDKDSGFTERYKTTGSKIMTSQAEETTAIIDGYTDIGDKDSDREIGFSESYKTTGSKITTPQAEDTIATVDHNTVLGDKDFDLEISFFERHNITGNKTVTLETKGDTLNVDPYTVLGDKDSATLAFISYSNLDSIIGPELVDDESNVLKNLQPSKFYSRVVTVTKGNRGIQNLSGNVSITFSRIQGKQEGVTQGEKVCVAWIPSEKGGNWSPSSCFLVAMNATHMECRCSVLSSFAVLLALYEITDELHLSILSWITYFGLSLSLLCLLVSIVTFFCCQAIQNINTTIKAHLCLSLFLAELLFLVASSIDRHAVLYATVASRLHYLFLAAFFWMCLEAVQLCLMVLNLKVVNFSRTRVVPRRLMYPIGYGCPAVIVIVTAAVNAKGYGTD